MSPAIRNDEHLYDIPDFRSEIGDAGSFAEELRAFHGEFSDCSVRSESGENFFRYMRGQLSGPERSAEAVEGSGKIFMLSVSCDTRCRFCQPVTEEKNYP